MITYLKQTGSAIIYFNNEILWGYIGLFLILSSIFYLTFRSRFMVIRDFPKIFQYFLTSSRAPKENKFGTSSLKVFFASLGGCIGIGNLATVAMAIKLGGPGALFWVCLVSFLGAIVKYAEIFLGLKFRVRNTFRGYDGGPMYFLQKAFPKLRFLPVLSCVFLCIYGVDIYMFSVVKTSFVHNFSLPTTPVVLMLLALVLVSVWGGIERVGGISTVLLPVFLVLYAGLSLWMLVEYRDVFPGLLKTVLISAFTGHGAVGGFVGSTFILTLSKGLSSAAYASDIGVGFASVLQSEVASDDIQKQASLSIFVVFLNTFVVCLCSMLLILVTNVWQLPIMDGGLLIQKALTTSFKNMSYFMPFFLFLVGYPSLISSLLVGVKAARFIHKKWGPRFYYLYAIFSFVIFSYFSSYYALIFLVLASGLLNVINMTAILKLRRDIDFTL
ncbi:MAG: sodium:alanine symporter family protein [Holosporaceae bacterium]|nr:MAG: sodium:alanine symporter family protein [Holosporaceae bacterium]